MSCMTNPQPHSMRQQNECVYLGVTNLFGSFTSLIQGVVFRGGFASLNIPFMSELQLFILRDWSSSSFKSLRQQMRRQNTRKLVFNTHYCLTFSGTESISSQDSAVNKTERPLSPPEAYMQCMCVGEGGELTNK